MERSGTMVEELSFLHYTHWDRSSLRNGQCISVRYNPSDYWKAKQSPEWAKQANPQARLDSILAGLEGLAQFPPFAEAVQFVSKLGKWFDGASVDYKFRGELLKEYVFEFVRREVAAALPSRWTCMFAFDESLDPVAYLATMPGMAPIRPTLIRIRPLEGARWHRARASLLNCNNSLPHEIEQRAREYWTALSVPELDSEVLLTGDMEIVEILTDDKHERSAK
jgi:hypothetical protein